MFQVSKKLKLVKYEVKDWAKKQFGNFQDKIFMNEQKIEYVERKLLENPNSFRLNSWMTRLIKQREKMLLFKQKYWGKLSRNEWLVKGDRNTNFFQRRANARRKRKLIMKIKDDSGIWIEDHKTIADRFITEFMQRFKSAHNGSRNLPEVGLTRLVLDTDNDELIKLPSFAEIKNAVFSIDSNKTPGSDGFGAGFFKRYWETIQYELVNCILEFFKNGKILKEINHTFITLIPKTDRPSQTNHFRLVSLCTTIYKIIAKILVNRMRPLLDKLISPVQSAFVPGRSIHDNILLTHEIMHKFKTLKNKTSWVAMKLDMKKAYDRLE